MKTVSKLNKIFFVFLFLLSSCTSDGDLSSSESALPSEFSSLLDSDASGQENAEDMQAGQITAGEWNDLENWLFWIDLLSDNNYNLTQSDWDFYTSNRLLFKVYNTNNIPLNGVLVSVIKNNIVVAEARTDNFGIANLFINLNQDASEILDYQDYDFTIDNVLINQNIIPYTEGENIVNITQSAIVDNKIEISFIVDATGSMSDELEFLKNDLQDVISNVQSNNVNTEIFTSAVFYRDHTDDYLVLQSDFTSNINTTLNFIETQTASGGGDFPEAVDVAISKSINDLQWSINAKTKIAFLLLDAPPHHEVETINSIHQTIKNASKKGIKIIPITASGIDKSTEFLMRYFAIITNGTYVFITNHSGIGNDHLEPTVGQYEVEYLNELMVRLINKYSE